MDMKQITTENLLRWLVDHDARKRAWESTNGPWGGYTDSSDAWLLDDLIHTLAQRIDGEEHGPKDPHAEVTNDIQGTSPYNPAEVDTLLARTVALAEETEASREELQRHTCALAAQLAAARAEIVRRYTAHNEDLHEEVKQQTQRMIAKLHPQRTLIEPPGPGPATPLAVDALAASGSPPYEKLLRFAPGPGETVTIRALTWRAGAPTVDEVRVCPRWWHRTREGILTIGPSVISLDIEKDGTIFVAEVGGERFLPEDWGTEWAPCLPPEEVHPTDLFEDLGDDKQNFTPSMTANPPAHPTTLGDVWIGNAKPSPEALRDFTASMTVNPPAHPTTLGDVWIGNTKPTPETLKHLTALESQSPPERIELQQLRAKVHELRASNLEHLRARHQQADRSVEQIYQISLAHEDHTRELRAEVARLRDELSRAHTANESHGTKGQSA